MASFRIRGEGLLFNNEMSEDVVVGLLGVGRWGNRWGNADIGHVMCMCVSGRRWAAGGHLGTPLHRGGKLSLFYRTTERQRDGRFHKTGHPRKPALRGSSYGLRYEDERST